MSREDREKSIKIEFLDGKKIYIPKRFVKEIVLPGVVIKNSYYRLVLDIQNFLETIKNIERKVMKNV